MDIKREIWKANDQIKSSEECDNERSQKQRSSSLAYIQGTPVSLETFFHGVGGKELSKENSFF